MLKAGRIQVLGAKPKQPVEGLFCIYSHRVCMQNRLDGYEYCLKHILEDKNAPFKQCSYTSSKSSKRCSNASPKSDKKDGYCMEHARRAVLIRQRSSRKKRPKETPETLLEGLDGYSNYGHGYHGYNDSHDHRRHQSLASKALEYASSSDSDAETPVVDQAWRGDGDSDAESIDSEQEDALKHAGVYTAEEVALIMRDKLIRLQSLYIDQFKRLQHVMKEKRRKYLHTVTRERETMGGLGQYAKDPNSQENLGRYTAMKRYHQRYGVEALLHRQSKERRIAASEGSNYRPPVHPRCINNHLGEKCQNRTLPLSKYCSLHIMNDPHQVLYRSCMFGEGECHHPVATHEDIPYCGLHNTLPPFQNQLCSQEETSCTEDIIDVTTDVPMETCPSGSLSGHESSTTPDEISRSLDPKAEEEILMKKGKLLLQHLKNMGTNGSNVPSKPVDKPATITSADV